MYSILTNVITTFNALLYHTKHWQWNPSSHTILQQKAGKESCDWLPGLFCPSSAACTQWTSPQRQPAAEPPNSPPPSCPTTWTLRTASTAPPAAGRTTTWAHPEQCRPPTASPAAPRISPRGHSRYSSLSQLPRSDAPPTATWSCDSPPPGWWGLPVAGSSAQRSAAAPTGSAGRCKWCCPLEAADLAHTRGFHHSHSPALERSSIAATADRALPAEPLLALLHKEWLGAPLPPQPQPSRAAEWLNPTSSTGM